MYSLFQTSKGLSTPNDPVVPTSTLTGGTFDLFNGHCDGQNGLHTHLRVNIVFLTLTVMLTFF